MHCYPAYKLVDVLNEYYSAFSYLITKKSKFVALERLEQIRVTLSPNMKKDEFSSMVRHYQSFVDSNKVVDSATINKDRGALRKLLSKK